MNRKKIYLFSFIALFLPLLVRAQSVVDTIASSINNEESPQITVGGYIDTYYGYDFSTPASKDRLYFVSSARHNEFTINLTFVDIKYTAARVRATLRPALGTYMAANYSAEPMIFRNLYEGNVGVKLFAGKDIWVDAGVLSSPYTNENAISKEHLVYTRSFAPEYVPYYLSGVKVSLPLVDKVSVYLYLLNGWQNIRETNEGKSIGTQLEYKPTDKWLINWNTYVGDERSEVNPANRMRYFSDLYCIFNSDGKVSVTACVYIGAQDRLSTAIGGRKERVFWHNANIIGRYRFTPAFSLSTRLEYFNDPASVQILPVNGVSGFRTYSSSICFNYGLTDDILLRMEGRAFFSNKPVYQDREAMPAKTNALAIASIAVSF